MIKLEIAGSPSKRCKANWIAEGQMERLHAVVKGRVQGVGFRYFVLESATELDLTGWVRNRWDESVEVVAEGEKQNLEQLLKALERGPRSAWVSGVDVEWEAATQEFPSFNVRMSY